MAVGMSRVDSGHQSRDLIQTEECSGVSNTSGQIWKVVGQGGWIGIWRSFRPLLGGDGGRSGLGAASGGLRPPPRQNPSGSV